MGEAKYRAVHKELQKILMYNNAINLHDSECENVIGEIGVPTDEIVTSKVAANLLGLDISNLTRKAQN